MFTTLIYVVNLLFQKLLKWSEFKENHRAEADLLRGLAIVFVVLFHVFFATVGGGFLGVDVFFVVSGFLIAESFSKLRSIPVLRAVGLFYYSRCFRMLPTLFFFALICCFLTVLLLPTHWMFSNFEALAKSVFFATTNLIFGESKNDYFDLTANLNTYNHLWSICVEIQFYLLFPCLGCLAWLENPTQKRKWIYPTALGILILLSIFFVVQSQTENSKEIFYLLQSRIWEFCIGILTFHYGSKNLVVFKKQEYFVFLALIAMVLLFIFGSSTSSFLVLRIPIVLLTALALVLPWGQQIVGSHNIQKILDQVLVRGGIVTRIEIYVMATFEFVCRWVALFGRASYSIYLWHFLLLVLLRRTVGLHSVLFYFLILGLVSWASFHYLEGGSARLRAKYEKAKWRGIELIFVLGLLALTTTDYLVSNRDRISLAVASQSLKIYNAYNLKKNEDIRCQIDIQQDRVSAYRIVYKPLGCKTLTKKLFIFGDSHALAYNYVASRLAQELGVEVVIYNSAGCGMLRPFDSVHEYCLPTIRENINALIRESNPGDLVFFTSLHIPKLNSILIPREKNVVDEEMNDMLESLSFKEADSLIVEVFSKLTKAQLHFIVEGAKPVFPSAAIQCVDWFTKGNPYCQPGLSIAKSTLLAMASPIDNFLRDSIAKFPLGSFWDPLPLLCPGDICQAVGKNGQSLFFDGDHLSRFGCEFLYPHLKALFFGVHGESK